MAFFPFSKRRTPSMEAFFASINLTDHALINTVTSLAQEVASSDLPFLFQRRNSRSIIRKIKVLLMLLEALGDSISPLPPSATLCFKELYITLDRTKILLDYCLNSSRLWLLIQTPQISDHFSDLNQEISTLLDVLPIKDLELTADIREQMELLQKQTRRSKSFIDPVNENLRREIMALLDALEQEQIPDKPKLQSVFDRLKINDVKTCNTEIKVLEEQICKNELDEVTVAILISLISLVRYCKFLLFNFEEESEIPEIRDPILARTAGTARTAPEETQHAIPEDFRCPISLDLMQDPVIVSTGQTFDRISISRWIKEGHNTCPKTGQMLSHTHLIPNRALQSLIFHWCASNGISYNPPESSTTGGAALETATTITTTKAAIQATKATAQLLAQNLSNGPSHVKTQVAKELRLLAKSSRENRACIGESGVIPLLFPLLSSLNPITQEVSVTALLNLSIHELNKTRIMVDEGGLGLGLIVNVLRDGLTLKTRENAAATLFSLSSVHEYKKRIVDEPGAVTGLVGLFREGSARGKKDAVTALFNLLTCKENCGKMVELGVVAWLVAALREEEAAEEAAAAVMLLVRQAAGVAAVCGEGGAVEGLMGVMVRGNARGKENAVAALLEMCRVGGAEVVGKVVRSPVFVRHLEVIMLSGTVRARRKAASLARVCRRCEMMGVVVVERDNRVLGLGGAGSDALSMTMSVS